MKRAMAVVTLFAGLLAPIASDVWAGAFAIDKPSKTAGPAVSATVVTVVAGAGQGVTTIRVQKGNTTHAAAFTSEYVASFVLGAGNCVKTGLATVAASTNDRFVGYLNAWVPPAERAQLVGAFGDADKAAITDIDGATCDTLGAQEVLSFTAVIQFATK